VIRLRLLCTRAITLILLLVTSGHCWANVLHSINYVTEHPRFSIVLIQTKSAISSYRFSETRSGSTVYVDLASVSRGDQPPEIEINRAALSRIRTGYDSSKQTTRICIDLRPGVKASEIVHRKVNWNGGGQIVVFIDHPKGETRYLPTEEEARQLREQGKRIVIIDPGHGWRDPGCQYYGMQEKTVVLDIARKLAYLIDQTGNMKAYLTRDGDYLPVMEKDDFFGSWLDVKRKSLDARVEFARKMHGHVFISLHLNYCPGMKRRTKARGFEIWCLGENDSKRVYSSQIDDIDPADLLAFQGDQPGSELDDETGRLLFAMQRDITMADNKIFVEILKNELLKVPGLVPRDPPIKEFKLFRVLRNLSMPSAIVEMAFLTNPTDAKLLKTTEFRWELARSLYRGLGNYFETLSDSNLYDQTKFEIARVSVPKEDYDIHVVQRGENLFDIAQKFRTDVSTLQRINNKGRSTTIYVGEELKVPQHGQPVSPARRYAAASPVYTVRRGDNLYTIAKRHGTTVTELKRINHLRSSALKPGQKLQLSGSSSSSSTPRSGVTRTTSYRVRRGDNLYTIAKKFHTSVPLLRQLNDLRTSKIYPGDRLRVPIR